MRTLKAISLLFALLLVLSSCREKKEPFTQPEQEQTHTLLMYMPWSNTLTSYFEVNVKDMEKALVGIGSEDYRVLVFFATSPTKASLYELDYDAMAGSCTRVVIEEYENHPCTTAEGIAEILNTVKEYAPADSYSMTIGGHGMGWLPVEKTQSAQVRTADATPLYHWEAQGDVLTRYFGGTSAAYQTDIETLAEGIASTGITMEYILFDDCYMSNVEVAYALRHVTRHFIASTSEVMAYGMPYHLMGKHMFGDQINYDSISQTFHNFYMDYSTPCGTIAMTVSAELDALAEVMREVNSRFTWDDTKEDSLQYLDGYSPHLFYDYGHYVQLLCSDSTNTVTDNALLTRFNEQLLRAVPSGSSCHTPTFYSTFTNRKTPITHFCGLTISDPSTHRLASPKETTEWWKATH